MSPKPRSSPVTAALALALVLLLAACGGADASCPNDLPAACPTTAPSYSASIDAIIGNDCRACHSPGGQQASVPLTTYDQVFARRSSILNQVHACRMPPQGAPSPTSADRSQLQAWLVCGAPNN